MKKCENCGKELNDNMSFCPVCGTNLSKNESDYVNSKLSAIIDEHWSYAQDITGDSVWTVLRLQNTPNAAIQLLSQKEDGGSLLLNFCLESSNEGDDEILTRFRKSPYINLVIPDGGDGLEKGDLSGIINFGDDIEKAKKTISLIFRDIYCQEENDQLEYIIEKDGNEIKRSAGFNNISNSGGKSCMGVIVIFIITTALIVSLI